MEKEKKLDSYYDGIPQDVREMAQEELEETIKKEKKKSEELVSW